VLVATTGAWLVSEVTGTLDVKTLIAPGSDILRWQWLDAANGQPGPEQSVTIRDSRTEPRTIADGRLLLIGRSGVLAIDSPRYWPVPVTEYETVQKLEWTRGARGAERIRLRQPVKSLPWQGRIDRDHNDVEYILHPAGPGLVDPLRKLIETEFGATRVAPTYGDPNDPDSTSYDAAGKRFRLWHDPTRRSVSVFAERIKGFTTEGTPALIERIGKRFNEILATGAHQQAFSSYLSHR
jgi:hypothetical protein